MDSIRTAQEFYGDITRQVRKAIEAVNELTKREEELTGKINSNNYAGQLLSEMKDQKEALRKTIISERSKHQEAIKEACEAYIEELKAEDDLNPALINDGDLKLLTSGIRLSDRDIRAMINRNEGNKTMLQIILRHCKDSGIDTGLTYVGNSNLIREVKLIPDASRVCFKYNGGLDDPLMSRLYNRLFGEGSGLYETFNEESE